MKKNIIVILSLASVILLSGCWNKKVDNESSEINSVKTYAKTYLTAEDLDNIEKTNIPLSYKYETRNSDMQSVVNSGNFASSEWQDTKFTIPEYANMVNREIISSGIDGDMIYTVARITLEDRSNFEILYLNEPDTQLYRAISIHIWNESTLYNNFVYESDIE